LGIKIFEDFTDIYPTLKIFILDNFCTNIKIIQVKMALRKYFKWEVKIPLPSTVVVAYLGKFQPLE